MLSWILKRLKGDKVIWLVVVMIALISLLAIYSATSTLAFRVQGGNTEYYMLRHLVLLGMGLTVMYAVHLLNYRLFARLANILLFVTIPLLIYTITQGSEVNEAARWITVFGTSFQPSDLAKLALIVFLAKLLTQRQDVIRDFYNGFLPALLWISVICGLIAPADLSTAALMFTASMLVMFIAGVDVKYLAVLVAVATIGLFILMGTAKRADTWQSRMDEYMGRWSTEQVDVSYQTTQANIAIATGGLFGKGAGKSTQRNYLPNPYADFVFAVIVEEYGLVGGGIVVSLYLVLLFRAVSIATVSKTFGALLASGLAFMIVLQAMLHMGVTVGLLPVTGLPLPLISMGGTSVIFTSISLGIILSVSRDAMKAKSEAKIPGRLRQLAFR